MVCIRKTWRIAAAAAVGGAVVSVASEKTRRDLFGRIATSMLSHAKIRCTPQSCLSWNFALEGFGHAGSTSYNVMTEQGGIEADGVHLTVVKHGFGSGRWTLERQGDVVAKAQKSTLVRHFDLDGPMGVLALRAASAMRRTFQLERNGGAIATLAPDSVFTRRATVVIGDSGCDWPTLCFAFWLTVLTWRRTAQNT